MVLPVYQSSHTILSVSSQSFPHYWEFFGLHINCSCYDASIFRPRQTRKAKKNSWREYLNNKGNCYCSSDIKLMTYFCKQLGSSSVSQTVIPLMSDPHHSQLPSDMVFNRASSSCSPGLPCRISHVSHFGRRHFTSDDPFSS